MDEPLLLMTTIFLEIHVKLAIIGSLMYRLVVQTAPSLKNRLKGSRRSFVSHHVTVPVGQPNNAKFVNLCLYRHP